jgi:hypothetical protein
MSDKSHVGMGYHLCPICYEKHDEVVLIDKHLRNTLERENFAGFELCPKHKEMAGEYIALVEVSNKAPVTQMHEAKPTGKVAHIRRSAWSLVFNTPCHEGPLAYCEAGTIDLLAKRTGQATPEESANAEDRVGLGEDKWAIPCAASDSEGGEPE